MGAPTRYNKSMKILQLNAWTGRIKYNIIEFLENNDFDVICLQEAVWTEDNGEELEYFFASLRQIQQASGLSYVEKASKIVAGLSNFHNSNPWKGGPISSIGPLF